MHHRNTSRDRNWEGPEAEEVDHKRQDCDRQAWSAERFHDGGCGVAEAQDYS